MYCALKLNEFNNIEDNVVIFKGTDVKNYTRANWNAVIFYTYLYHNIWKKQTSVNDIVKFVQNKYNGYDLSRSITDIKWYIEKLDICNYINDYNAIKSYKAGAEIANSVLLRTKFDEKTKSGKFTMTSAYVRIDDDILLNTPITVTISDGKIAKMRTESYKYRHIGNLSYNMIATNISSKKPKHNKIEVLDKTKFHLLKQSPIGFNIQTKQLCPINRCYINAPLIALYALTPIRKLVNELASKPLIERYGCKKWQTSHAIKQFFDYIETGKNYDTLKQQQYVEDLIDSVTQNGVVRINNYAEKFSLTSEFGPYTTQSRIEEFLDFDITNITGNSACMGESIHRMIQTSKFLSVNHIIYMIHSNLRLERDKISLMEFAANDLCYAPLTYLETSEYNITTPNCLDLNIIIIEKRSKDSFKDKLNAMTYDKYEDKLIVELTDQGSRVIGSAAQVSKKQYKGEVIVPEEVTLKTTTGDRKYRIMSTIDAENGYHFKATVRTNQGWYEIDDLDNNDLKFLGYKWDENKSMIGGNYKGHIYTRHILCYELIS